MGFKKAIAIELQKIDLEDGDCLLVKFNTDIFDLDMANHFMGVIKDLVPKNIPVIGYPNEGVEFQVVRKL